MTLTETDQSKRKSLIFSIKKILEKNIDLLEFWSKITLIVKSDCKDCYGRGYTDIANRNLVYQRYVLCKCLTVDINWGK